MEHKQVYWPSVKQAKTYTGHSGTPHMMDLSSLNAHNQLRQNTINSMQQGH